MFRFAAALLLPMVVFQSAVRAELVELANGDRLNVTVVERTDEHIVVEHPVLGRLTLPAGDAAVVETPAGDTAAPATPVPVVPQPPPAEEPAAELREDPKIFGIRLLPGWKRRIELGMDGSEGNSQTFNFRAGFAGEFEDEQDRWKLNAAFVRQTTDGDKTRNDFFAEAVRDWLEPGRRHFYFAQTRYDYDDFQSWRQRAAFAGGVGYPFVKRDDFELTGRAGLGANYTWGGDGDDEVTPEALLGIEGVWKIDGNQRLEFKNTLHPSLADAGEFRNLTSLAYIVTVDQVKGLSLKFGLENEYESSTDDDSEHNDLKYFAALVFEF